MFKILKLALYAVIIGGLVFMYWFMPKYSFVRKNPGFCTQLTAHLYYCGTAADLDNVFSSAKK